MDNSSNRNDELVSGIAYLYDGSLEGLLSAVFETYISKEKPEDIFNPETLNPRLGQHVKSIPTNINHATRIQSGIRDKCSKYTYRCILKASLSSNPQAPNAVCDFIHYAMSSKHPHKAINDISDPHVEKLFQINRTINKECEFMRQFARFEHIKEPNRNFWFAKINPKDNVIPLIMDHFVERFNIQPFIIYDENHNFAGFYDGNQWTLIKPENTDELKNLKGENEEEAVIQDAWRRFYKALSVDERYNPELRRQFMPKRFWKNLTEMRLDVLSLYKI